MKKGVSGFKKTDNWFIKDGYDFGNYSVKI